LETYPSLLSRSAAAMLRSVTNPSCQPSQAIRRRNGPPRTDRTACGEVLPMSATVFTMAWRSGADCALLLRVVGRTWPRLPVSASASSTPRIEFPGALYHITSRGNERRPIFSDDVDRTMFLTLLGRAVKRFGWSLTAWVLMTKPLSPRRPEGSPYASKLIVEKQEFAGLNERERQQRTLERGTGSSK
jgi:hypothetical protein